MLGGLVTFPVRLVLGLAEQTARMDEPAERVGRIVGRLPGGSRP